METLSNLQQLQRELAEVRGERNQLRQELEQIQRYIRMKIEASSLQADPRGLEKYVGLTVKRGFSTATEDEDMPDMEYMWVAITSTRDGKLYGTLASNPALATYLSHGDEVEVMEDEIVGVETD